MDKAISKKLARICFQ